MKTFTDLFSDSLIKAFGWTLVHSVWQAFAMMFLAAGALYLLKKKTAQTRYLTAISFLSLQFGASLATFLFYLSKTNTAAVAKATVTRAVTNVTFNSPTRYTLSPIFKMQLWLNAHLNELVICWLIGAGLLLLKFLGSWIVTERLRLSAHAVMDKEWRARFGLMIAKMQISQSVDFKETAKVKTPIVLGTFSPVILIPIGLLSGFSVAQVEAILAHELAHIKRHDYLVNLLQSILEVIFFFHPAIWWLSDRIRIEREHCCDDIALEVCGDKMSLAHALVKVAEWQSSPALAMAFAAKRPLLLNRIQRVLGVAVPKRERNFGYLSVILLAMSLVAGISVYATAQKNDKQKVKKTAKSKTTPRILSIAEPDVTQPAASPELEALRLAEFGVPVDVDLDMDMDFGMPAITIFGTGNDTLDRKISEIQKRIEVLQKQTEPLHERLEEIQLDMEKHQFQVERLQREREKVEWKKSEALERRAELMEKSREVFENRSETKGGQKPNSADLEKQVTDFEQQIQAQEETVSQLNAQLSALRKDITKADEPIRAMDPEIQDINTKMEEISGKITAESSQIEKIEMSARPRVSHTTGSRKLRVARVAKPATLPPPPPPAKAAKVPAAPVPPARK